MIKLSTALTMIDRCKRSREVFGVMFFLSKPPYGVRKIERAMTRPQPKGRFEVTDKYVYLKDLDRRKFVQFRKRLLLAVQIGSGEWMEVE